MVCSHPKWLGLGLVTSLLISACSTTGVGTAEAGSRYRWVPGVYEVEGAIRYRADTLDRERFERVRFLGEVTVGPAGPTSVDVQMPVSACLAPERAQNSQTRRRLGWDIRCGDTNLTLWSDQGRVRGSVSMTVTELRRFSECVQYTVLQDGSRVCVRQDSRVQTSLTTRSSSLQSIHVR